MSISLKLCHWQAGFRIVHRHRPSLRCRVGRQKRCHPIVSFRALVLNLWVGTPTWIWGGVPRWQGKWQLKDFYEMFNTSEKRKRRNNTINASKVINKLYHKTWSNIGQIVIYRQVHCLTQSFRVNQATSSTSKYKTSGIRSLQNKSTSIDCYRGGRDSPPEFARCTMTINS